MKPQILFVILVTICLNLVAQLPKNNPYIEKYGTCPSWVNEIKWNTVIDIKSYAINPSYWDSYVAQAISDLQAIGGGVLYFPSGTYNFSGNIQLASGIVLRGAKPSCLNAKSDSFAPPTRLIFPAYIPTFSGNGTDNATAFKAITGSGIENAGFVYLDINRGRIGIGWNGSLPSRNIIVFGVRQNNVAQPQSEIPVNYSWMNQWQRFSYRHCRNISVSVSEHASVTNNRVNDFQNNLFNPIADESYDQPDYIAGGKFKAPISAPTGATNWNNTDTDTTHIMRGAWARFSYTDHYGIGVSGQMVDPNTLPHDIDQKIELNDNWVYVTMRVGLFGEGFGLTIKGNVRTDNPSKRVFLAPTGQKLNNNNSATFENRAMNFAGNKIRIEDNDMRVYRHSIMWTGYGSVDGEGILMQYQDVWGKWIDSLVIINNKVNSYIGLYDLQFDLRNIYIQNNDLMNGGNIQVFKKEATYRIDQLYIENNKNITGISVGLKFNDSLYNVKGYNLYIRNNQGSGKMTYPCQAIVQNNTTFTDAIICNDNFNEQYFLKPYFGQLNVNNNPEISVEFLQNLQAGSMTGVQITGQTSGNVAGINLQISGTKLIINHALLSIPNETYTISVPAGVVKSAVDATTNNAINWWFRTAPKPYAISYFPSDSGINITPNTPIFVEFNQILTAVDLSTIKILDQSGVSVSGITASLNATTKVLTINHTDLTKSLEYYTVIIPSNALQNSSGFSNDTIKWAFKTMLATNKGNPKSNIEKIKEIRLYPNPTNGILSIENIPADAVIKIMDLLGNELTIDKDKNQFDLSKNPSGIYLIKIESGKKINTFKVIKK